MATTPEIALDDAPQGKLGAGFWAGWAAAMVALNGGFIAAMWLWIAPQMNTTQGVIIGGVAMVAFTVVLMFLALAPMRARQKRGIEGRTREPLRRYNRRLAPAMLGYVVLLLAAITYSKQAEPTGVIAWLVAIAPVLPLLFAIRAIALLPREEDDEYQREKLYRAYTWATGATLMIGTMIGFLDMFGVIPHVEMWIIFPVWAASMGLARCFPLGGAQ